MAKKPAKRAAAKKTAAAKSPAKTKTPTRRPALPQVFVERWMELASATAPTKLSARLVSSIITLRPGQVAGGPAGKPDIVVFARDVQGTGCDKRAEIAGWYSQNLAPNGKCIGQAAVKAALDAAAQQECCNTLKCPDKCPCRYIPQAKLAAYRCVPGVVEEGFLLQNNHAWNCICFAV